MAGLRIIAGRWRGKALAAPAGQATRPTNIRARQAIFDILLHAPWAGPAFMQTARVLDAFAGTGAYGLEALSRGAIAATFIENDRDALAALRANICDCKAQQMSKVIASDVLRPPQGTTHNLVFLDPPYGHNLVPQTIDSLSKASYFSADAVFVAELGPNEDFTQLRPLAVRQHGKARILIWSN